MFTIIAVVLFINNICADWLFFGDLIMNSIKEKPVITKKINRRNIPLDESFAKAWTLVNIPDLTKKVPMRLSEKHKMLRKIVHLFSKSFCSDIINEDWKGKLTKIYEKKISPSAKITVKVDFSFFFAIFQFFHDKHKLNKGRKIW